MGDSAGTNTPSSEPSDKMTDPPDTEMREPPNTSPPSPHPPPPAPQNPARRVVMMSSPSDQVDVLILGAGWTSRFLIPLLEAENITYAATTRSGSEHSIPFLFDPLSNNPEPYTRLPSVKCVIITFPIKGLGGSRLLTSTYRHTHPNAKPAFIQLGSTGIWTGKGYSNRLTPPDPTNERGIAEGELLSLGGAVLNLAGLWGGERNPKNWVLRILDTKEKLVEKTSVHLIHGIDVAYAIVALMRDFTPGQRWMLTDLRVYDWWDLASVWGDGGNGDPVRRTGKQPDWVRELMVETGVRSLPRSAEMLGRVMDSMDFWVRFKMMPKRTLAI